MYVCISISLSLYLSISLSLSIYIDIISISIYIYIQCIYILYHPCSPRGQPPLLVAINRGVLQKTYKWMGASKHFSIQKGFVHQPALCSTPAFCREVYFARMFDFYLFLNMSLACMLGPWSPTKASFCKNLLLCHVQPILFVRKWDHWYLRPVFFNNVDKKWSVHTPFF